MGIAVGYNAVVALSFVVIRKWSEVKWPQLMWRGFVVMECGWWCVTSSRRIQMILRSMENDSRVPDKLYMLWGWLVLEDFLFFSLYSFSCIEKLPTTLKQLRLWSCLDALEINFEPCLRVQISHYHYPNHQRPTPPVTLNRVYQILYPIWNVLSALLHSQIRSCLLLLWSFWQLYFDLLPV